jgi:predicted nucleotidyltransferase
MVSREEIQAYADKIAERFHPEKIILFGSQARGEATPDSDVDILVLMEHNKRNIEQALFITDEVCPPFSVDLLVWRPNEVEQRIAWRDFFLRDIVSDGLILYHASRH